MKTSACVVNNRWIRAGRNFMQKRHRFAVTALMVLVTSLAGSAHVALAGGAMGRSSGSSSSRSGGSMARGGSSIGRGARRAGSSLSRAHGGGNSPTHIGNLSGTHFNNEVGMPKGRSVAQQPVNQPKVQSNHRPYIPYFRTGPNSPWMPYGVINNYDDAVRATHFIKNQGYESFMRNR
ncbi:MAG: hypothetical protein HY290_16155 [Planctomycetia bacterium]|nr:hypothetical protein [Planctomycetia bacterium]